MQVVVGVALGKWLLAYLASTCDLRARLLITSQPQGAMTLAPSPTKAAEITSTTEPRFEPICVVTRL